jgi:hypothetical protein
MITNFNQQNLQRNTEDELKDRIQETTRLKDKLLFECDISKDCYEKILDAAKRRLSGSRFPKCLDINVGLTILTAFSYQMSIDDDADNDDFYNRLSSCFFNGIEFDAAKQTAIRDFVEDVCKKHGLLFLKKINRQCRSTIWLHGGLPAKHSNNFFEHVLMPVSQDLSNLDSLLQNHTSKAVSRFFQHGETTAKGFLRNCIDMRDDIQVVSGADREIFNEFDFNVSPFLLSAFKKFLEGRPLESPKEKQILLQINILNLKIEDLSSGKEAKPTESFYAFTAKGRHIKHGLYELPKAQVHLVYNRQRYIIEGIGNDSIEWLSGQWSNYNYVLHNLSHQDSLIIHDSGKPQHIDVVQSGGWDIEGEEIKIQQRSVYYQTDAKKLSVYTKPPSLMVENVNDAAMKKLKILINSQNVEVDSLQKKQDNGKCFFKLLHPNLIEGINSIRVRGIKHSGEIEFAYFPDLNTRLDKLFYTAPEEPILTLSGENVSIAKYILRINHPYKNGTLSIPIPRHQWKITGYDDANEPIVLPTEKLPSNRETTYLHYALPLSEGENVFLRAYADHTIIKEASGRFHDGEVVFDLVSFKDAVLYHQVTTFKIYANNQEIDVLHTHKTWTPSITCTPVGNTITFEITESTTASFKNRRLIVWHIDNLWLHPIVIDVADGTKSCSYEFSDAGCYGVEATSRNTEGWGEERKKQSLDIPISFAAEFEIQGNTKNLLAEVFSEKSFMKKRELLLKVQDIERFILLCAYRIRQGKENQVRETLHAFISIHKGNLEQLDKYLYMNPHENLHLVRNWVDQIIQPNHKAIITKIRPGSPDVRFQAAKYDDKGFMLSWHSNAKVSISSIGEVNAQGKRYKPSETYTLIAEKEPRATALFHVSQSQTYTLIAEKDGHTTLATLTLPQSPFIRRFYAIEKPNKEGTFKLVWEILDALEVEIDQGIGKVGVKGEKEIKPIEKTTYTVKARGKYSTSQKTVRISFKEPIIHYFHLAKVAKNKFEIRWKVSYATNIMFFSRNEFLLNIEEVPAEGSKTIDMNVLASARLIAKGRGGKQEKAIETDKTPLPQWAKSPCWVDLSFNNKIARAKFLGTTEGLFEKSGRLKFSDVTMDCIIIGGEDDVLLIKLEHPNASDKIIQMTYSLDQFSSSTTYSDLL